MGETETEDEGGVLVGCGDETEDEAMIEFLRRTHLCRLEEEESFERAMDDRDMFEW